MKKIILLQISLMMSAVFLCSISVNAQLCEWRLANVTYSSVDPDGGGVGTGTVTFTMQVRTTAGSLPNISAISTGWSWQSANAMVPVMAGSPGTTTPGVCTGIGNTPTNVVLSPEFAAWQFNTVNQCFNNVQNAGGQNFDRTVIGTLETAGSITITTTFVNVYTVTMWTTGTVYPHGGYAVINSTNAASPGPFPNYEISDNLANAYQANSVTYSTPLPLGPPVATPVLFTQFDVNCGDKGAILSWTTATEINNSHFEIQRNTGSGWIAIGQIAGAGNSSEVRKYQFIDLEGGSNAAYQIKQVDLDGHFSYSAQRSRSCTGRQVNVVLYPVPTNNVLNVAIRTDQQIRTELQVFDMSGRIVKRQAVVLNTGTNNLTLDVHSLAVGEYILTSSDKNIQLNKKFTIAR